MIDARAHDQRFVAVAMEEANPPFRVGRSTVELLHIAVVTLASQMALALAFYQLGQVGWLIATSGGALAFLALLAARSIAPLLGDLYRQMQYRERFLLFMAHLGLVIVPWVTGMASLTVGLMGLMLVLCLQCIDRIFHGRLLSLLWLLATIGCLRINPAPPLWLVVGFGGMMLLAYRLAWLRYRLEEYNRGAPALPIVNLVLRGAWRIAPTMVVGGLVWWLAASFLTPRQLLVRSPRFSPVGQSGVTILSLQQMFWFGLLLVAIIIGLLVSLQLLDKLLKKRQPTRVPAGEAGAMLSRVAAASDPASADLLPTSGESPSQRVIQLYRNLVKKLGSSGMAPAPSATAAVWLGERGADEGAVRIFDRSCYSKDEVSELDADEFAEQARRIEESATLDSRRLD